MNTNRKCLGLRREDKSVWERRVAVTPQDAGTLRKAGIDVAVQPSSLRVFSDEEFLAVGALVQEDLGACPIEIGIKEMKPETFRQGGTYVFFSHTIKGQSYNMPMLKRLMDLGCNLIDYEKVTDENGKRLIFFGNFAGMAGMMETLVALERRMAWEGMATPLAALKRPLEYHNLEEAKEAVRVVGDGIRTEGFLPELAPVVCGFAGYGNVARGAWEILDLLPVEEVPPGRLAELIERGDASRHCVYKVVFREEDTAEPLQAAAAFRLQDYYQRPDCYRGVFERYVPYLTMLVNCIYWEDKYPRLITKKGLRQQWECGSQRLKVIGDISADLEGAVECTVRITDPGAPYFVYDPLTGGVSGGVEGRGVVVMSVDILPSELPRDASVYFSGVLRRFIPALVHADYSVSFGDLDLPPEIKRAVIVYHGRLTPDFEYMEQFL